MGYSRLYCPGCSILEPCTLNSCSRFVSLMLTQRVASVSLFADSVDFLEDTAVNLIIFLALGWSAHRRSLVGMALSAILLVPGVFSSGPRGRNSRFQLRQMLCFCLLRALVHFASIFIAPSCSRGSVSTAAALPVPRSCRRETTLSPTSPSSPRVLSLQPPFRRGLLWLWGWASSSSILMQRERFSQQHVVSTRRRPLRLNNSMQRTTLRAAADAEG